MRVSSLCDLISQIRLTKTGINIADISLETCRLPGAKRPTYYMNTGKIERKINGSKFGLFFASCCECLPLPMLHIQVVWGQGLFHIVVLAVNTFQNVKWKIKGSVSHCDGKACKVFVEWNASESLNQNRRAVIVYVVLRFIVSFSKIFPLVLRRLFSCKQ